jgi:hypothetical protein
VRLKLGESPDEMSSVGFCWLASFFGDAAIIRVGAMGI